MHSPTSTSDSFPTIAGYAIVEQLYLSSRTVVYRAIQTAQQRSMVIKVLQREHPSFSELVQFRNQYTIAKHLPIPGVVQPLSLEPLGNSYILVMEDFGSMSLEQYGKQHALDLTEVLAIALQLTEILHHLCQYRVVHKDIKPANILIHPDSKQIKLIDFSIASLLPRETQEIQSPNILEGTLAYLAPEQTGRMNRGIDYRADFYALGITLYQLLSGQLPFAGDDPLELVHCHIAKVPISVNQVQVDVPAMVAAIVAKLMAKNAEDRYQSALGLKHDLEQCLQAWKATGTIALFELGQRDLSDRFLIPGKLYGREVEVQTLLEAFERIAGAGNGEESNPPPSRNELMLVAGFSGIGKTAVINEIHKPIVRQRGYFIKGKFDQFQRNIPFSAFVQAFRDLMGQLLSESDAQLTTWKVKILDAVGKNGQVIVDVIPELEQIIGQQPLVPEFSGSAVQNRFNLLFQKFIQVFTTPDHPLVIFLDDLQWADSASLNLLTLLMSEASSGYLLILGAYRDNEVFPAHPLMLTLEQIQTAKSIVNTIILEPLVETTVNQLVADTLSCTNDLAYPLTQLVYQKTKGNPFFTTQFLKALHEEGWIQFHPELGYWQCDLTTVRQLTLTDDVVEFMALQLQKLPAATQAVLKLAACIGNQFDLQTLAPISEQSSIDTATHLWKALQEGLILPIAETYKFFQLNDLDSIERGGEIAVPYKFSHDRVQQAAYSLIPPEQRASQHLQIGRLLLQSFSQTEQDDQIFKVVSQLSQGRALIVDPIERRQIAQLSYIAGLKAKTSTAYTAAAEYLKLGIELLDTTGWQDTNSLALTLHRQLAEVEFLCGHFEQSTALVEQILAQTTNLLVQAEVYNLLVVQHTFLGQHQAAIAAGMQALKLLDIDISTDRLQPEIQQEVASINRYLQEHSVLSLLDDLAEATDPRIRIAVQLLVNLDPPVYLTSNLDLYILISAKIVALSLQHGYIPETVKGYGNYGWLSGIVLGNYQTGYEFGVLGMELARKLNDRAQLSKVSLSFGSWIHSWSRPVQEILHINDEGYTAGLESGEVLFGGYNLFCKVSNLLFSGVPLNPIDENLQRYLPFAKKTQNSLLTNILEGIYFLVQPLLGKPTTATADAEFVTSEAIVHLDRQQYLETCKTAQDFFSLSMFYIWQMQLCCINQTFAIGLEYALTAKHTLQGALGFTPVSEYPIYESLIVLNLYDTATPEQQAEYLQQVRTNQAQYKIWVDNCPENFLHKYLLIEAELYRIQGDRAQAADCYDRAIATAKANQFTHIEALAAEFAGRFYLAWGRERIAQDYLLDAYYGYVRWGAKAKTHDLEQCYPNLLHTITAQKDVNLAPLPSPTTPTTTSNNLNGLDLKTVMKASLALSSEIILEQLIANLMKIVVENAGAQTGILIIERERRLVIEAVEGREADAKSINQTLETQVPISAVNYVIRTLENVVLNDAVRDDSFGNDPYIVTKQPKSVLCVPLIKQGKLIGVLYLENNLTTHAFSDDRLEVLKLLCSQAAISLENANLVANLAKAKEQLEDYNQSLEAKVQERTQELKTKNRDLKNQANQLKIALKSLKETQTQLIQSEKMSSLGQLVAGVAHEINNPVSFIHGNLVHAQTYVDDLLRLLYLYDRYYPNPVPEIREEVVAIDLNFLKSDFVKLMSSMEMGTKRIQEIVCSLRNFSRLDEAQKKVVNIHEGLDSTLLILQSRLFTHTKPIEVIKDYGELPFVDCYAGQLNQVFMNLLSNGIDAIDEKLKQKASISGIIQLRTRVRNSKQIVVEISDNGIGMSESVRQQLFNPFFTTKPVGKGTGLGLAISYSIIVEKHSGQIECHSILNEGTTFVLTIPIDS
ncbi:AAA family ATPase [Scytonema sp. NUACC26]|uniref:trifunctional serine/threonine-protein kinase/ATP-binding protein/sensor histidine kinase n=1 Tax=Scytonema sp. NUACC26 TaxID=3140176 RepID=UPI0034DC86BC